MLAYTVFNKKKSLLFYLTAKSSSNETPAFYHHSFLQQKFAHSLSWLKNIKTFSNYIKYDKATFIFVSVIWKCKLWFNKYWIILYVYSKQYQIHNSMSIKINSLCKHVRHSRYKEWSQEYRLSTTEDHTKTYEKT